MHWGGPQSTVHKEIRMKMLRTMALTMTLAGSVPLWAGAAAAGQSKTLEGDQVSIF